MSLEHQAAVHHQVRKYKTTVLTRTAWKNCQVAGRMGPAQVEIEAVERGIPADLGPGAPVDRMKEHLRDKLGGSTI